MVLDLTADVVTLTRQLVDIESVSRNERAIADAIEAALRALAHLDGDAGTATPWSPAPTSGRGERVVIAGHLDTVPVNDNLPARLDGDAPARPRHLRHEGRRRGHPPARRDLPEPNRDVTYIFYECEEIEAERNGLYLLAGAAPSC